MELERLLILQFTMFAEMAAGYVLCAAKVLKPSDRTVISRLVVNVFLPCSIVNSFGMELSMEILARFMQVLAVSACIQLFCHVLSGLAYNNLPDGQKRVLQYSTLCSNAGFLGNAVALGVYGELGLAYAQFYLIPVRIMMWTEGVSLFAAKTDKRQMARTILTHPCIIACALGIVLMALQIQLPAAVKSVLSGLGNCGTPCIMIFLGMIMQEIGFSGMCTKVTSMFAAVRLALIPLCVLAACTLLKLDPAVTGLSVLLAAMPAGSTTAVLAQQYHADEKFAANIVVFTTLLSIALLPAWVMIIHAFAG